MVRRQVACCSFSSALAVKTFGPFKRRPDALPSRPVRFRYPVLRRRPRLDASRIRHSPFRSADR